MIKRINQFSILDAENLLDKFNYGYYYVIWFVNTNTKNVVQFYKSRSENYIYCIKKCILNGKKGEKKVVL